jgi:hypothetical protein
MDIAWIKVVVLTLAECVAPEGKTVCQEQQVQYYFVDEVECQKVLEQLIDYRDGFENVIVNKEDSSCLPATKSSEVFSTRSDADPSYVDEDGVVMVGEEPKKKDFIQERHDLRLQSLPVCDDAKLVTPCRRGEIIIESVTENKTEVWKQDQ